MQLNFRVHRPQSWHLVVLSYISALLLFALLCFITLYLPDIALMYAGVLLCIHFGSIRENIQVGYARVRSWIDLRLGGLKVHAIATSGPVAAKQVVIRAWKSTLCSQPIAGTSMLLAKRAMLFNNPLDYMRALNDSQEAFGQIKDVVSCSIIGEEMIKTMQNLLEYYALAHHELSPVKRIVYLIDNTIHQSFSAEDVSHERLNFLKTSRQFLCLDESYELFSGPLHRMLWIPEKFYTTEDAKSILASLGSTEQQKMIHHDLFRACVANLHIEISKAENAKQFEDLQGEAGIKHTFS